MCSIMAAIVLYANSFGPAVAPVMAFAQDDGEASASETPPTADADKANPLTEPQQPGDDVSEELKNPLKAVDAKKTEAQAAYMAGVAAQKKGEFHDALKAFRKASKADPEAAEPVRAEALLLMRLGRVKQAEEMARKAVAMDTNDYQTRLQLALMLSSGRGQRVDAAEVARLIEEALSSETLDRKSLDFIHMHRTRGRLYIQAGDGAKAAESYSVLLDALEKPEDYSLDFREHQALMHDRVTGYETIGKVMLEVGRYDKAETAFGALVRVNKDAPGEHHYWLALTQYRKDDLGPANENLKRYFETRRRTRESLQLLTDLLNADGQSDQAPERIRDLAADTADADTVNMFLGDLLVREGKGDEAVAVYQSVIENSGTADAYLGLIRVDILNQDAESLLKSVTKALRARIQPEELTPLAARILNERDFAESVVKAAVADVQQNRNKQNPSATYFYSQIADELKMLEQEGQLLQATLDQNPAPRQGIAALGRLGWNLYMQDDYAASAEIFRRLLSLPGLPNGERVMTLYRLSLAESANENYDVAITAVETALKAAGNNAQLTYQLGLIQLQAERFEDSEATLRKAVKLSEGDARMMAQSRLLLGALFTQQGRWSDAVSIYNDLLDNPEIDPKFARRGRMALSNAYVQQGDLANGEKILEDVYNENPDDPGANNDLGYLYADQNKNLEKAEKMVRIAIEAEPDNPAYLDSLGWVLYRLGRHEEALEALSKATSDPDYQDSTILEHRGDVQKALEKPNEAAESWKSALDVEKESSSPDEAMIKRLTEKLGPTTEGADTES